MYQICNLMSAFSSVVSVISTASTPITLMGVTGQTGGHVVNTLLARNDNTIFIRGIVRSQEKGQAWKAKLSEKFSADTVNKQVSFVVADQDDLVALTKAFTGSSVVYVMLSPQMSDPSFDAPTKRVSILTDALKATKITHIVALSSAGAHLSLDQVKTGAIYHLHLFEKSLVKALSSSTTLTFIRAGLFFENSQLGDFPQAKYEGKYGTFFAHLNTKYPYLSAKDIGAEIAKRLVDRTERKNKPLYIELEGPQQYSINDFATIYSKAFGREVVAFSLPPTHWSTILESIGIPKGATNNLEDMYASLNEGKIVWENTPENGTISVKGTTTLEEGLTELIRNWEAQQAAAAAAQLKVQ